MSLPFVIVGFLLLSCAGSKKSPTPTPTPTGKKGATADSGVAELQSKLKTLESKEQNSRALIVQLRDKLADLEANPGQAPSESLEELREKLSALKELTDHSEEIAKLQGELNELKEGEGDNDAERIAELTNAINEWQDKFDALQDKLDALSESTEDVSLSQVSSDNVAQQPAESSTEPPTGPPTLKAYLTHAGISFFEHGLIQVVAFSNITGVTDIKQTIDLNSGSIELMPTTTISFQFSNQKYCASVALTKEQFVSYKEVSKDTRAKETKKIEVSKCN